MPSPGHNERDSLLRQLLLLLPLLALPVLLVGLLSCLLAGHLPVQLTAVVLLLHMLGRGQRSLLEYIRWLRGERAVISHLHHGHCVFF